MNSENHISYATVDYVCSLSKDELCRLLQEELSKPIHSRNNMLTACLHEFHQHFRFLNSISASFQPKETTPTGPSLMAKSFVPRGHIELIPIPRIPSIKSAHIYINMTNLITGSKSVFDKCMTPMGYIDFSIYINFNKLFEELIQGWKPSWVEVKGYTCSGNPYFNPDKHFKKHHCDVKNFSETDDIFDSGPYLITQLNKRFAFLGKTMVDPHIGNKIVLVAIDGETDSSDVFQTVVMKYLSLNIFVEVWAWRYFCHPLYTILKAKADEIRSTGKLNTPIVGFSSHHIPYFELKFLDDIGCIY